MQIDFNFESCNPRVKLRIEHPRDIEDFRALMALCNVALDGQRGTLDHKRLVIVAKQPNDVPAAQTEQPKRRTKKAT